MSSENEPLHKNKTESQFNVIWFENLFIQIESCSGQLMQDIPIIWLIHKSI